MRMFILLLLLIPIMANAQSHKRKPKNSVAKGTFYGYWGYNRSGYSKSNIRFVGPGYDFNLNGSRAHDNQSPFSFSTYFNPKKITVPQFNARVGYYFKNHWAIDFGYDHMKYVFDDGNNVLLSGTINPGIDTVNFWSGNYTNEPITTNRNTFHYENSNGLNYLRLGITRSDNWYKLGNWLMISSSESIGLGGILSYNDFKFAGKEDLVTVSMSGYAISAHAGLRFEFFKHFFIQPSLSAGFMHQTKVRTRALDPNSYARQKYGYYMFDTSFGFFLYIRPTNDCNSCPNW